jgi:peptidoglycan hydrolase-like amidase
MISKFFQRIDSIKVDIENYYLKNVLPREMDVAGNPPTLEALEALKAQALAARSIADWKAKNWGQDSFKAIANYTVSQYQGGGGYQVFFPDAYDTYYNHNIIGEKARVHDLIDTAISETSGEYLFYPNNQGFLSIDAEFSNDIGDYVNGKLVTVDGNQDYLIPIQDPISDGCDLNPVGNGWGMSQKGAIRWSKGNQWLEAETNPGQSHGMVTTAINKSLPIITLG